MKPQKLRTANADVNGPACSRGYALLILMMMVTLLLIGMTAAMPSIYTEAQREKEAELLFRGAQYQRAIAAFHQQFNRYPATVDELLKKTNGRRFLRQAFKDPMVRSGKWRFIHADATGILIDSLTQQTAGAPGMGAAGGAMGSAPGMNFGSGATSGPLGATGFGQSSTSSGFGASSNSGNQEEAEKQKEEQKKKLEEQIHKECEQANAAPDASSSGSSSSGSGSLGGGRYIAGVASCSTKESIRVLNGKTHYNEWEFLGIVLAGNPGMPGAQPGTQPGMPPGTQPGIQPGTQPGIQPGAGGAAGSTTTGSAPQPNAPAQAGPQIPPLTDQPNQPGESDQSDQPGQPEPDEPQR